eukprot:GGOE01000307.1.p1 GENE.GGOE01000307.1~~GGOE01000307.1.p1  ORF type:complete len:393 (-),score=37.25 GGOE01000307.1:251-1429(-)
MMLSILLWYLAFGFAMCIDLPFSCSSSPKLHAAMRKYLNMRKQGVLTYLCKPPCGGLGDRLKGLMTTFLLAALTGKDFRIQFVRVPPLQMFLQPATYVQWQTAQPLPKKVLALSNFPMPRTKQLKLHSGDWLLYLMALLNKDTALRVNRDWIPQMLTTPLRRSLSLMGIDGVACLDLSCIFQCFWDVLFLGPMDLVLKSSSVEKWSPPGVPIGRFGMPQEGDASEARGHLGLHLRVGGAGVAWTDPPRLNMALLPALFTALASLLRQAPFSQLPVFLCADSAIARNLSRYLNHSVFWLRGEIIHVDKSRIRTDVNCNAHVWTEWFALASARHTFAAPVQKPSGFVQTAIWRSRGNITFVQEVGASGSRVVDRCFPPSGSWRLCQPRPLLLAP